MAKNYLIYPCKVMRITQNYNGKTSHYPHTVGSPRDYPIDEGCSDTGKEYIYCPCDQMKVKRIYGVGTRGVNTIWLESTDTVCFADGTSGFFTMLLTHPDDSDLKKLKVGQTFKRGQAICREGKDGATANHLHISAGKGKYKGNGWTQNTRGKYVLTTTGGTYKPEKLFYVDKDFTKVVSFGGLTFRYLPIETKETVKYAKGKYTVTTEKLNVRKKASTKADKIPYSKFSTAAKKQIKALKGSDYKESYFVKGMKLSITKISGNWGYCKSNGWVCLDYCKAS